MVYVLYYFSVFLSTYSAITIHSYSIKLNNETKKIKSEGNAQNRHIIMDVEILDKIKI